MEEEELKKEKNALFWAKWLHNTYENISKDQDWETQKECQVEFDKLPSKNKAVMLRIGSRLEIQFRMMKDKGFQAGQLAERKRCLKMIEELKKKFDYQHRHYTNPQSKKMQKELLEELEDLQQKIKEMK